MKIKRLGKIFCTDRYGLPFGCQEFAQSPQLMTMDGFVRVYFSTRVRDSTGKFLSKVAFVDMDSQLESVLRVSQHEVIPLGELGCFDEHGIFPFHVFRQGDSITAYTTGWSRRSSVSVETGIGVAVSRDDGFTFKKVGAGPVLSASLHEPFLVADAFVRYFQDRFHMWYIYGCQWKIFSVGAEPERIYKIGHATSSDGINWTRHNYHQLIPDAIGGDESQALPSVIYSSGAYHMFFCYRESSDFRKTEGRGYRIGYAKSADLHHWVRADKPLDIGEKDGTWDSKMQAYPHICQVKDRVLLLYNGNEFGRFGFGAAEIIL